MSSTDTVLLRPRPYARYAGVLLLVPLLPQQKPLKALPAEVWAKIFAYVLASGSNEGVSWWLAEVCKPFHVSEAHGYIYLSTTEMTGQLLGNCTSFALRLRPSQADNQLGEVLQALTRR